MVLVALTAGLIARGSDDLSRDSLQPPGPALMGTDDLGRDILAGGVWSPISLVGFLIARPLTVIGICGGVGIRGRLDDLLPAVDSSW
jgi:ABC-type dipeptide/oligopeptide/nickel transport system permease subunit